MIPRDIDADPDAVVLTDEDVAQSLLCFLQVHGAEVRLTDSGAMKVGLDSLRPALDATTAARLAPIVVRLIPALRTILRARREPVH